MDSFGNIKYSKKEILKLTESNYCAKNNDVRIDTIFNDDFQSRASYHERILLPELIKQASESNLQFDINWNTMFFFSKKTTKQHLVKSKKTELLELLENEKEIYYRCSDFMILRYLLAIEVNGIHHDNANGASAKDRLKQESLTALGIETLTIDNYQLNDPLAVKKFCTDIINHIVKSKNNELIKRKVNSNKVNQSKKRKKYNFTNELRNGVRGLSRHQYYHSKPYRHPRLNGHPAYTIYCGVIIPINRTKKFPISSKT